MTGHKDYVLAVSLDNDRHKIHEDTLDLVETMNISEWSWTHEEDAVEQARKVSAMEGVVFMNVLLREQTLTHKFVKGEEVPKES